MEGGSSNTEFRVSYTCHTEENLGAMRRKELGYVPDGYEEVRRDISNIMFDVTYENECGELMTWKQILVVDGSGGIMNQKGFYRILI